ncbi:hypothetical protein [Streptomyces gardneri]|uniref:hypothetical protein n=1 Tax=Streptomyces gardneri TaxID=66892 RepID=UPI0035DC0471
MLIEPLLPVPLPELVAGRPRVSAELTDPDAVTLLIGQATNEVGAVAILVNNAGAYRGCAGPRPTKPSGPAPSTST